MEESYEEAPSMPPASRAGMSKGIRIMMWVGAALFLLASIGAVVGVFWFFAATRRDYDRS